MRRTLALCILLVAAGSTLSAQGNAERKLPTMPGQAAYAAIQEVVSILEADSRTDWSRVNLEALRQHLIDMNEVTLRASVQQRNIPGGAVIDVTGEGATADAIRRMLTSHSRMLDQSAELHAVAENIPAGTRLTVTARDTSNAAVVSRIRGLGFAGLLVQGDHHRMHHLALARGESHVH